jgi:hypothetical protein
MVQVSLYRADFSPHKLVFLYRLAILHDEPLQVPVFLKNNITRVKCIVHCYNSGSDLAPLPKKIVRSRKFGRFR